MNTYVSVCVCVCVCVSICINGTITCARNVTWNTASEDPWPPRGAATSVTAWPPAMEADIYRQSDKNVIKTTMLSKPSNEASESETRVGEVRGSGTEGGEVWSEVEG